MAAFRETETLNEQTILVVGVTGSGKTSLIQYMTKKYDEEIELDKIKATSASSTKDIIHYESDYFIDHDKTKHKFQFYDTIGIGADDIKIDTISILINKMIQITPTLNKILIVMKMERNRDNVIRDLHQMIAFFNKIGAKERHLYLILTHAEHELDPLDFIKKMVEDINTNPFTTLKIPLTNTLSACFANLLTIKPMFLEVYRKEVAASREKMFELLKSKSEPFAPLSGTVDRLLDSVHGIEDKLNQADSKYIYCMNRIQQTVESSDLKLAYTKQELLDTIAILEAQQRALIESLRAQIADIKAVFENEKQKTVNSFTVMQSQMGVWLTQKADKTALDTLT